jgi:hypothetical protein
MGGRLRLMQERGTNGEKRARPGVVAKLTIVRDKGCRHCRQVVKSLLPQQDRRRRRQVVELLLCPAFDITHTNPHALGAVHAGGAH